MCFSYVDINRITQFKSYNTELLTEYKFITIRLLTNSFVMSFLAALRNAVIFGISITDATDGSRRQLAAGSVIKLAAVGSSKHAKHLFTSFNMAFVTDLQCGNDCRWKTSTAVGANIETLYIYTCAKESFSHITLQAKNQL